MVVILLVLDRELTMIINKPKQPKNTKKPNYTLRRIILLISTIVLAGGFVINLGSPLFLIANGGLLILSSFTKNN